MIRVAIAGASGRMGRALIELCAKNQKVRLTHAFERPGHSLIGKKVNHVEEGEAISLGDSIKGPEFDVLIDFTAPESSLANLDFCVKNRLSAVIGTTGFDDQQVKIISEAANKIPVVLAPNMSVGVNICLKLLEVSARAFGDEVDIEVIESHHKDKVDAPSGTALKMGEVIANVLKRRLESNGVFARHGKVGPRKTKEIGFSAIRAGNIVGEHSVWFEGPQERVEITHKASSREIYASGALRSAVWLYNKDIGLYDMQDVLGLKTYNFD